MGHGELKVRSTWVCSARAVAVAASVLLVLTTAGCGDEQSPAAADEAGVPVYFVEDGKLKPVLQESSKPVDSMRPQGRAELAVRALLRDEPAEDAGHSTHWGRSCVSGASIKSLTNNAGRITLTLGGAGGRVCTKKGVEDELQQQQLAWTIVENFDVDPSTPIAVIGQNGAAIWESLVADESLLAG